MFDIFSFFKQKRKLKAVTKASDETAMDVVASAVVDNSDNDDEKRREFWKQVVTIIVSAIFSILSCLGVTSCIG